VAFLFQNHSFRTGACGEFRDVTDDVRDVVRQSGVRNGMAVVYSPHTTCSIVINEREQGFLRDFARLMDRLVPCDGPYDHDDVEQRTENLDDPHEIPNGWAHCRQSLLGVASQTIPVVDGRMMLGRYQRVFFVELDRARDRRVLIEVMGE
jgi:secondary thiamine-phosphate synthase enzyme